MRLHRRQPTRLPCPWDSPGKNTGVGCHFLLQCRKVKSESEVSQLCPTLSDPMDCSLPGSSIYGIFQARVLEWGAIAFSESSSSLQHLHSFLHLTPWALSPHSEMPTLLVQMAILRITVLINLLTSFFTCSLIIHHIVDWQLSKLFWRHEDLSAKVYYIIIQNKSKAGKKKTNIQQLVNWWTKYYAFRQGNVIQQ